MTVHTDNRQQAFLEFLRFAIDENAVEPQSIANLDWEELLSFGVEQTIIGILFHGLKKMRPDGPNRPDKYMVAKWFATSEYLVAENRQAYRDAAALTRYLYGKAGIKSCVLKGQGNAMMYPDPYMRTPGDIDLWTDRDTVPLLRFILSEQPDAGIEYHHVDFSGITKTPAEIHFFPSFMGNLFHEYRLRKYFERVKSQQFTRIVTLPDNAGRICVPTDSFNRVFQMSHIMHHFYFEGVGLRQIIDYYYLLKRGFTDEERREEDRLLGRIGMRRFAGGVMWVLHEVLGLEERLLLVPTDEKFGRLLMREMLLAGNFGHHDTRYAFGGGKSPYVQYFIETFRNLHFAMLSPSETIWGRPVSRWWHMLYKAWLRRQVKK